MKLRLLKAVAGEILVFVWLAILVAALWFGIRFLDGVRVACLDGEYSRNDLICLPWESPADGR